MWTFLFLAFVAFVVQIPACSAKKGNGGGGDVSAVYNLLDRVLAAPVFDSSSNNHTTITSGDYWKSRFHLQLCDPNSFEEKVQNIAAINGAPTTTPETTGCSCGNHNTTNYGWFCLDKPDNDNNNNNNNNDGPVRIFATSVSELSYGLGYYFRYYCNFTLGWERIGGSVRNLTLPDDAATATTTTTTLLPKTPIWKARRVPYSYLMNVCTHSYSLVWHDWSSPNFGWEAFLDWASLMGVNNLLALTGQEEIQYKVFSTLGLKDYDIRSWFNGPAFLTWSRGQNEYGSNIAGPLPRSWMKQQWQMQKLHILPRLHELGMIGQLPGFQGNVPIQLQTLFPDSKMTKMEDTGWLDAMDPLYAKIADLWMTIMLDDFGRDVVSHWYQLDGYLNGGVPPWFGGVDSDDEVDKDKDGEVIIAGVEEKRIQEEKRILNEIEIATTNHNNTRTTNADRDDLWYKRGVAAFTGLNRTDPEAIWSFQGFSFIFWNDSDITASWLKGFVDSTPPGRFVIIDMAYSGLGEWTKWNNASYFGADFIWSALHNFGDTNGMKGDMYRLASIITDIQSATEASAKHLVGIGGTPEGIDQNPVYYEFLFDQAFASTTDHPPNPDVETFLTERAYRRYGGIAPTDASYGHVTKAWQLLAKSSYATEQSVQDLTGVAHLNPREGAMQFEKDRITPKSNLCSVFNAWKELRLAAEAAPADNKGNGFGQLPFLYDLVNTGREVLAQLSVPIALNFSDALQEDPLDELRVLHTGMAYRDLLKDLDHLLGTHSAFLLGPWIEAARYWGNDDNKGGTEEDDCYSALVPDAVKGCRDFYEWNARVQITTWNPTGRNDTAIPGGPIDYAAKHWSGLVEDYYDKRVALLLRQGLYDAHYSGKLNETAVARHEARHAYSWTTSTKESYPSEPSGYDPVLISRKLQDVDRYGRWFSGC